MNTKVSTTPPRLLFCVFERRSDRDWETQETIPGWFVAHMPANAGDGPGWSQHGAICVFHVDDQGHHLLLSCHRKLNQKRRSWASNQHSRVRCRHPRWPLNLEHLPWNMEALGVVICGVCM